MEYIEVKIYTTKDGIEPVTGILMDAGLDSFVIEDADDFREFLDKKHSYDWDFVDEELMGLADIETNLTVYLEYSSEGNAQLKELREAIGSLAEQDRAGILGDAGGFGRLAVDHKKVSDDQWKDKWKEYFKPSKITDRIVIKPTWEPYEKQSGDELIINIDPGMAFGTGTHPTTSMCIKLMEAYLEPGQDTVLDVGCGSGILSIAGALLGAKETAAVDIDPIAVEVATDNVKLNGLQAQIDVFEGDLTKGLNMQADIVVANLIADLVIMLAADVAEHLKGKSIFISSGILAVKKDQVAEAIEECGFQILQILEDREWCAIAAKWPTDEEIIFKELMDEGAIFC